MTTHIYDEVRHALGYIPSSNRELWLRMGMAIKAEFGEEGFSLWDQWSRTDKSYSERDAKAVWRSIRQSGGVTIGTLYYEARARGWQGTSTGNGRASRRSSFDEAREQLLAEDAGHSRRQQLAAAQASEIWNAALPAPPDHAYLVSKGVQVHSLRRYSGPLRISGVSCDGALIVPVRDAVRDLKSLQFITSEGKKLFLPGGLTSGCYFAIVGVEKQKDVIVIVEGYATSASSHEASGHAVAAALFGGNLVKVAKVLRGKYPSAEIIIGADNDAGTDRNPGIEAAQAAAAAVNGVVAVPELDGRKCDFNDLARERGVEAVRAAFVAAQVPKLSSTDVDDSAQPNEEDTRTSDVLQSFVELAQLSRVEYDRVRKDQAKAHDIQLQTLDHEVSRLRKEMTSEPTLTFKDPDAWPTKVKGSELLDRIRKEVDRYLVLPPHGSIAVALWCLHTWSLDAFFITPYLYARSPQKRSGKSTLMMIVLELVRRALLVTSASPAAIFRSIEEYRPTLLLDEADAWMRENEELRGILNGGHSRKTARVIRTVGEHHDVRLFSTFCPKAISGIGQLADTLEDRSIIIPMKRKHSQDRVDRLREDQLDLLDLRRQCRRWSDDELESLRAADPATPPVLNDRAADNWRPLLAVADTAGGEWPQQARAAAVALSGQTDDEAIGTQLLEDIRDYFGSESAKAILSANLAEHLGKLEERPWADWKQGKIITAPQIARLLKPFEIRPRTVRLGLLTAKGYLREQFEDAFGRYLQTPTEVVTPSQLRQSGSESDIPTRHNKLEAIRDTVTSPDERVAVTAAQITCVTPRNDTGRYENRLCDDVTAPIGAEDEGAIESDNAGPL